MTITQLHHVQLAMPAGGEEAARVFYGQLLGLPEVPKPRELAKRGGCWFEQGDIRIHMGVEAEFRPAKKAHPAFQVSDIDAVRARMVAGGVEVKDDDALEGFRRFFVADPFGNRIEILQPL
ncbi:VOC family protein [Pyruvatibacter mobilis]|jgi:catechol 2,3-dioxygenase-like lactoylglutathione lyase family enzyme|uniref:VOC family protein n=1 Tax=Pyruvatibacter mobilis TaxID=1712261 RepID=UPI003BAC375A